MTTSIEALAQALQRPTVTVRSWTASQLSLSEALTASRIGDGARAIMISPQNFRFAILKDGTLSDRDGRDVSDQGDWYDVRCFTDDAELRWAVPIGEEPRSILRVVAASHPAPDAWSSGPTITGLGTVQTQLLWGTVTASADGWSTLREARTGRFEVPCPAEVGERVHLLLREVLAPAPDGDGNMQVAAELLHGLSPIGATR